MTRPKFDSSEFEVLGTYPKAISFVIPGMPDMPPEPKLSKPISPKENFKLLLSGKKPYWIPRGGFFFSEVQNFRPRLHPDNIVTHLIFDGEAPHEYTSNKMVSGFFDLEWEYVEAAGGATVHPGNPKVPYINKWEEYVSIPDLDELDWDGSSTINIEYCNTDKFVQVAMLSGFWERLISLMGVDHAAVSLIDEDQKEGVKRLFDNLADLFIDQIRRYNKYFNIDCVLMHDDWGHQHSTFFSITTCREMIVPYFRKVTDVCHELGLSFEFHSCGKNQTLVPAMLEAGIDMWCPQTMNDFDMLTKTYKDSKIVFGLPDPAIPVGLTEAETRQLAKEWVEKYKDCRVMTNFFMPNPIFQNAVYEYSRKAYENEA